MQVSKSKGIFLLSLIINIFYRVDAYAEKNISNVFSKDTIDHFFYSKQHVIAPQNNTVLFNRKELEKKYWQLTVYPYSPTQNFCDGTSCNDFDVIKDISRDSLHSFFSQYHLGKLFSSKNEDFLNDYHEHFKHTMQSKFPKFIGVLPNEDVQTLWFIPEFLKYHRMPIFKRIENANRK